VPRIVIQVFSHNPFTKSELNRHFRLC